MTASRRSTTGPATPGRIWPDTFVGVAVSDRGALSTLVGTALGTLLAGPQPAAVTAWTRK